MSQPDKGPGERHRLAAVEQFVCALPMGLVVVGALLGGVWGAVAWAVNYRVMRSGRPPHLRYLLVALTTLAATAAYFVSVSALTMALGDEW